MSDLDLYAPATEDELKDLFGARFPLSVPNVKEGSWKMSRDTTPVERGSKAKDPRTRPLLLKDEHAGVTFKGLPEPSSLGTDASSQYFVLIKRGQRHIACPIGWWYAFKRERKTDVASVEEVEAKLKAQVKAEERSQARFRSTFNVKEEEAEGAGIAQKPSSAVTTKPLPARAKREPDIDELFGLDEDEVEGWDHDEEIANEDLDVEVDKEVEQQRMKDEVNALEAEGEKLREELLEEGYIEEGDLAAAGEAGAAGLPGLEDNDLAIDLDEDEDMAAARLEADSARTEAQERAKLEQLRRRLENQDLDPQAGPSGANEGATGPSSKERTPMMSSDEEEGVGYGEGTNVGRKSAARPSGAGISTQAPAAPTTTAAPAAAPAAATKRKVSPASSSAAAAKRQKAAASASGSRETSEGSAKRSGGGAKLGDLTEADLINVAEEIKSRWPRDVSGAPAATCNIAAVVRLAKEALAAVRGMTEQEINKSERTKEDVKMVVKKCVAGRHQSANAATVVLKQLPQKDAAGKAQFTLRDT